MAPDETTGNPGDTQRILAEVLRIGRTVDQLAADWQQFRPVAEGFSRGGLLAARTAARRARNQPLEDRAAGQNGEQTA